METLVVVAVVAAALAWFVARLVRKLTAPPRGGSACSGCSGCGPSDQAAPGHCPAVAGRFEARLNALREGGASPGAPGPSRSS